jgi:hypothetical protein
MIPAPFIESNIIFHAPDGLEESQVMSIPAYRGEIVGGSCDGLPQVVVAWTPTPDELEVLKNGHPIFLSFVCDGLPPHFPSMSFHEATHPA